MPRSADSVFRKHGGKWGLFIETDILTPIQAASREHRVLAAGHLKDLINALVQETATQTDLTRAAVEKVGAILTELDPSATRKGIPLAIDQHMTEARRAKSASVGD